MRRTFSKKQSEKYTYNLKNIPTSATWWSLRTCMTQLTYSNLANKLTILTSWLYLRTNSDSTNCCAHRVSSYATVSSCVRWYSTALIASIMREKMQLVTKRRVSTQRSLQASELLLLSNLLALAIMLYAGLYHMQLTATSRWWSRTMLRSCYWIRRTATIWYCTAQHTAFFAAQISNSRPFRTRRSRSLYLLLKRIQQSSTWSLMQPGNWSVLSSSSRTVSQPKTSTASQRSISFAN